MVRHADPERDAADCAAIYAPNVDPGTASFEDRAPSAEEMAERIAAGSRAYPWLVAERDGRVAGYAYGSQHRTRASYRWAVDVTVYVDTSLHRSGVGRELYEALLELLARQRYHVACAGITLPNDASVGLHEAVGFEPVGDLPRHRLQARRVAQRRLVAAAAAPGGVAAGRAARSAAPVS